MKNGKKMKSFWISAAALLCAACSAADEPAECFAGSEKVLFSAAVREDPVRSVYGDLVEGENSYWPIYWIREDRIAITDGSRQGVYTVEEEGTDVISSRLIHDSGTEFSTSDAVKFHAVYPAEAASFSGASVRLTTPSVQTMENGACNMNYAFMAASADAAPATELRFEPLMTAVDISLTVPAGVSLRKIVLSSPEGKMVAGTFVYDFAAETCSRPDPAACSSRLAVHLTEPVTDADLHVTVFLLPDFSGVLRVDAITDRGILGKTGTRALTAGCRHSFSMGTLPSAEASAWREQSSADWMNYLPDNAFLSMLSLPGTHDAVMWGSYVVGKTQVLDFGQQFEAGIRALDLRPGCSASLSWSGYVSDDTDLYLYHGTVNSNVRLSEALAEIAAFLNAHPTETVFVLLHEERIYLTDISARTAAAHAQWMSQIPLKLRDSGLEFVRAFEDRLTLGEARGKVVLLSRDDYDAPLYGGKIGWGSYNGEDKVVFVDDYRPSDSRVNYQDQYEGCSVDEKREYVRNMLSRSASDGNTRYWYLNHVSFADGMTSPASYANRLLPAAAADVAETKGRTGVMMMDYAGNSETDNSTARLGYALQKAVIASNDDWDIAVKR